jgi:hypothetical protein
MMVTVPDRVRPMLCTTASSPCGAAAAGVAIRTVPACTFASWAGAGEPKVSVPDTSERRSFMVFSDSRRAWPTVIVPGPLMLGSV